MSVVPKPLRWRGSSKADYLAFPESVQREMGYGLYLAQMGERHAPMAKTLKGFQGGSVVELKESDSSGTYRAVYTVRFADSVYVLHAFQKKARRGIETPKAETEIVNRRLRDLIRERDAK
jgi:phage-related protein